MPPRWFPIVLCIAVMVGSMVSPVSAQDNSAAERVLPQAQEQRARALFRELRCVVCQNQSIDGSNADVAKDLRRIVRDQIAAGQTDQQVRSFLVERYGEFVLLKPRFAIHTVLLWLAPVLLLLVGAIALFLAARRRPATSNALSASEDEALEEILRSKSPS